MPELAPNSWEDADPLEPQMLVKAYASRIGQGNPGEGAAETPLAKLVQELSV